MENTERTYHFKKTLEKKERFVGGHRLCAGCGAGIAVRGVLRALREEDRAVVGNATGCLEVSSFLYPYTAYEDSYIHTAFESAGASLSGVEAAYNALKRKGKVQGEVKFITFGGDGGTYDIGFQSLSGAMERGHDLTYVCYDNEAYMNTGIQRSSSTPRFAKATTSPVGSAIPGKLQNKKNLTEIIAAHHVPYVAQTTFLGNFRDLYTKAQKAIYTPGPSFLNIMAGVWHLSYQPKQKRPVEEYLRLQGRFRHMFKPGNEWMIEEAQRNVDENWEKLLAKCQG